MRWAVLYGAFVDDPQALSDLMVLAWQRVAGSQHDALQARALRAREVSEVLNVLDAFGALPPAAVRGLGQADGDGAMSPYT